MFSALGNYFVGQGVGPHLGFPTVSGGVCPQPFLMGGLSCEEGHPSVFSSALLGKVLSFSLPGGLFSTLPVRRVVVHTQFCFAVPRNLS